MKGGDPNFAGGKLRRHCKSQPAPPFASNHHAVIVVAVVASTLRLGFGEEGALETIRGVWIDSRCKGEIDESGGGQPLQRPANDRAEIADHPAVVASGRRFGPGRNAM